MSISCQRRKIVRGRLDRVHYVTAFLLFYIHETIRAERGFGWWRHNDGVSLTENGL